MRHLDLVVGIILLVLEVVALSFFGEVEIFEDFPVLTPLVIILVAMVVHLRFTIVDEGTAKLVTFMGKYWKTLLVKGGYKIDPDGEIVLLEPDESPPWTLPGGLRFVGIWPFFKVHTYDFKWVDGTMEQRHEQGVNFVLALVDYLYGISVEKAEDSAKLPMNVDLLVTAAICNPRKAIFGVKDWFRTFSKRLLRLRRSIASKTYDDLQSADLEAEFAAAVATTIRELRQRYGVLVRSIEVSNIDPDEKFRKLTLQRLEGKMNAEQAVQETSGRSFAETATKMGLTVDELKLALTNPTWSRRPEYEKMLAISDNQVARDRAAEKGEFIDIRAGNSDGTSFEDAAIGPILSGFIAYRMATNPGQQQGRKGKPKPDDDDDDPFATP